KDEGLVTYFPIFSEENKSGAHKQDDFYEGNSKPNLITTADLSSFIKGVFWMICGCLTGKATHDVIFGRWISESAWTFVLFLSGILVTGFFFHAALFKFRFRHFFCGEVFTFSSVLDAC